MQERIVERSRRADRSRGRPMRFLVVEDNPDHAFLVMRALRDTEPDADVTHLSDGDSGLRYLRKESPYEDATTPDVTLLDLNLPKLNGHQVLEVVKSDPVTARLPIVILTTSDAESDRTRSLERHANSYLVKPTDFSAFKELLHLVAQYWGTANNLIRPSRT